MTFPTISVVTCSYNSDLTMLRRALASLKGKRYPPEKLEHIVMDGGSTNGSLELFRQRGTHVEVRRDLLAKPQARMSLGIARSLGELVLILEPDNILPDSHWLRQMVKPFQDHAGVVGAFSMYNSYDETMPLLTKYCALIGANDPTIYYLNKSEKLPRFARHYTKGEILLEAEDYCIVRFNHETLPTLGDNGHMVRRSIIQKVNTNPETFIHVDAFAKLLALGHGTYAAVKNSVVHYTGTNIFRFMQGRVTIKEKFYNRKKDKRSYFVFDPHSSRDRLNLLRFIVFSLTFIEPLLLSFIGFLAVREAAWFLHPVVCFVAVLSYTWSELVIRLNAMMVRLRRVPRDQRPYGIS